MPGFSANLGFLWTGLGLPDAILAAKSAGFDAVECHWPFGYPPAALKAALGASDIPMLCINTVPGDKEAGDFGLAAISGRQQEAQLAISQAVTYADEICCPSVHVMAGNSEGGDARDMFLRNLQYACDLGKECGVDILIEPLNPFDAPGYFLNSLEQAREIIDEINLPNLKLMFDCYHVGRMGGDVMENLTRYLPIIGHIQFASVPDRGPPDHGTVDYGQVFSHIDALKWDRPIGAEYHPVSDSEGSLDWLGTLGIAQAPSLDTH